MGMRVASTGSAAVQQSPSVNNWQQRQSSINSLTSALQSGNLSAAQSAFGTLSAGNGTTAASGTGTLAQIGQALQNGDLSGAQKLAQTLQSSSGRHHHGAQNTSATPTASTSSTPTTSLNGSGSLINTTA